MDSIERRLDALEKSNRRWRMACIALVLLFGMSVLLAAERGDALPDVLRAKRIEVMDSHGKPAIELQAREDGSSIVVWGPDRDRAAILISQEKRTSLMLMKNKQTPILTAEAGDETGQIALNDGATGAARSSMYLSSGATGFNVFHSVGGHPESRLGFSRGGALLELKAPGGKAAARIVCNEKGGKIDLLNVTGESTFSAPPR